MDAAFTPTLTARLPVRLRPPYRSCDYHCLSLLYCTFHSSWCCVVGTYVDGELHGLSDEVDDEGFVTARGQYERGAPVGEWTVFFRDGGRLVGPVDGAAGVITGLASYHYPDDTELRGLWQDGRMVHARYMPDSRLDVAVDLSIEYILDESTGTVQRNSKLCC